MSVCSPVNSVSEFVTLVRLKVDENVVFMSYFYLTMLADFVLVESFPVIFAFLFDSHLASHNNGQGEAIEKCW